MNSFKIDTDTTNNININNNVYASDFHLTGDLLQQIFEYTNIGIVITDITGRILDSNIKFQNILGYSHKELLKLNVLFFSHPDDYVKEKDIINEVIAGIIPCYKSVKRYISKVGEEVLANLTLSVVKKTKNMPELLFWVIDDITEEEKTRHTLQEFEKRFKVFADLLPTIICETDTKFNIDYINKRGIRIFGLSDDDFNKKINLFDFIHKNDLPAAKKNLKKLLKGNSVGPDEYKFIVKDGQEKILLVKSVPIEKENTVSGIRHSIMDITERQKIMEHLIQSEKLMAASALTAGLAHEFKNILTGIIGMNNLIFMKNSNNDELAKYTKIIEKLSSRGTEIVSDMLEFARPKPLTKELCRIDSIIDDVVELKQKVLIMDNIHIEKDISIHTEIKVDTSQMQHLFLNLIVNAQHALIPKGGGIIKIYGRQNNKNIEIRIKDNGTGMTEEIKSKIFTPFYTTKVKVEKEKIAPQGSGLGLMVVYNIVKNHKGTIKVDSEVEKGTTFIIKLPVK